MKQKKATLLITLLVCLINLNFVFGQQGPNAPEASNFEPVSATDMVNLSSGDMAYVLPLFEIDGFPVTLNYHAGIPMDMEASWVGLGWNINTGSIARGVSANPDDWGIGRRLNLTYLNGEIHSYTVNVGVGFAKAAEVGVGLSWGSNKSISGSVSASIGPASASIDTNGNYSVGVGTGGWGGVFSKVSDAAGGNKSPFGGSLSISGNVKKGGIAVNIGVGGSAGNMSAGMGVSISGQGVSSSFSVGGGNAQGSGKDKTGASGGGNISMNSFSAGDYSYNSKGFYIPIQIGIFSFGFGFNKTEVTMAKAYNKYAYGILYHDNFNSSNTHKLYNTNLGEDPFPSYLGSGDYQRRNVYGDVYEQVLPQTEQEFIGDYRVQIEKLNFSYAGYDSYSINASGIGGALRPIVGENIALIGEGYDGQSVRTNNGGRDKTKVFYHNSNASLKASKKLNLASTDPGKLNFSFDGQITEDAIVSGASINNYTGSVLNLNNFINAGNSLPSRPKSGSYVEVFTNEQINTFANATTNKVLIPASLKIAEGDGGGSITRESAGYVSNGIGGYKITTPDGKTYHFMQPVYQYEQVQHSYLNFNGMTDNSIYNSSSKREATPYATHWLLTAITGPDFIDANNNNFADEGDYGYWLRLDHGQWSNAYAWRSPFDNRSYTADVGLPLNKQSKKHYSTYIDDEVEKSDPGYFIQGRKDLYYLDKIVSKNQTAYFVKDIRYDAYGASAPYIFTPISKSNRDTWEVSPGTFNDPIETNPTYGNEEAYYEKEYQLRLDKIIIVNNKENYGVINKAVGNNIAGIISDTKPIADRYPLAGSFFRQNLENYNGHMLHASNNVIDVNDVLSFDYSKASKVIKFKHDYTLAKKTPSSGYIYNSSENLPIYPDTNIVNSKYGRLTLNEVKIYGSGKFPNAAENDLYDYMPAYKFSYKNPDAFHEQDSIALVGTETSNHPVFPDKPIYKFNRAKKDNWGFRGDDVADWSLNEITTPQGSTIKVEYEEDEFYVEAFGRRFWNKNLAFKFIKIEEGEYELQIQNHANIDANAIVQDFNDYFEIGSKVYIDFYLCYMDDEDDIGDTSDNARGAVDIRTDDTVIVKDISYNNYGLQVLKLKVLDTGAHLLNETHTEGVYGDRKPHIVRGKWFDDVGGYKIPSIYFPFHTPCGNYSGTLPNEHCPYGENSIQATKHDRPRGLCPSDNNSNKFNLKYKLLANKVPPGTSGGGLRVKDIVVNDGVGGSEYITRYNYDNPTKGRTSGITSFNPVRGEVYVPYQNELPGPGVMYEWVTMEAIEKKGGIEKKVGSTRYHYYTLNPYFAIFNPDIDMKDSDGESIFKAKVEEVPMSFSNTTAKKMRIEKNLTKIGQLISIEEFNKHGHLMSKTKNTYDERLGELSETFSSMKSVFDYKEDSDDDFEETDFQLHQRYLALSTKSEKVSVIKSIENAAGGNTSKVTYSNPDPWLGTYTTSIKSKSDGTYIKEEKIPAYTKYPQMGSKVLDPTNKNMLTQEAMSITSWSPYNYSSGWKTLNAGITTWSNDWIYRDQLGNESSPAQDAEKIWRKHKTYVWKDDVNPATGAYEVGVTANNDYFDWAVGEPTNNRWKNTSEVTRYTHWSSPLESRDINTNFVASKMADRFSKVVASGNARYTELYYSGAEHIDSGNNFEGEIEGANYATQEHVHTGEYAIKLTNSSQKGFKVTGTVSSGHNDLNVEFRPGVYKASVWVYNASNNQILMKSAMNPTVDLIYNGDVIPVAESEQAGDWILFNYYITLEDSNPVEVYFRTQEGINYLDDFRLHPVYASMNSYVYDKNTDELVYILDANNLATKYIYDKAGRLCKVYKEVVSNIATNGGFKLVNQYKYHYKGVNNIGCDCCENSSNSLTNTKSLEINSLKVINAGAYVNKFYADAGDTSNNYTYQWRWLTDYDTYTFSPYITGTAEQEVPFAVKLCTDTNSNLFDKYWEVEVKVTDNTTGKSTIKKEQVVESGCKFYLSNQKWADIEISTNYNPCTTATNYTLRPFVIKPEHTNYSYKYQTYNYNTQQWSGFSTITNPNNIFCGTLFHAPVSSCKSGYTLLQTIKYRVINTITGEVFDSNSLDVYLDCVETPTASLKLPENEDHLKYGDNGTVLERDTNNKIINVFNFEQ